MTLLEFDHLENDSPLSLQQQIQAAREFNKEVAAHEPRIRTVNESADKFIKQSKVCVMV